MDENSGKDTVQYFSEGDVKKVAERMREVGAAYEQLFSDLGKQLFSELDGVEDNTEVMARCIDRVENTIAAFDTHFPDSPAVACKKGCHYCCSFNIECPPQVVMAVARHIKESLPDDQYHLLIKKLQQDSDARSNFLKRAPCPFLDKFNACSIYEKRPLACRWFSSPDAAICQLSLVDGRKIPQHPTRNRIYQVATTILLACAKSEERYHQQVAFIPSLLTILTSKKEPSQWWDLF